MDLSYPPGRSINDGIPKDSYLDINEKLTLPSVDGLADRIMKLGRGCKVFKIDLSRAYRQMKMDPGDVHWLGYVYKGRFYFDCTLSMGSRSSARCCQMVTSAVVFIYTKFGYFAINYLDDLGSAEEDEAADTAFFTLLEVLHRFGLQEAMSKSVAPCFSMVFLGIEVNTLTLTLTIPEDKWAELRKLLSEWKSKQSATLKQVQKLAGHLNFACRCVRSGRVYLSRILNFLRSFTNEVSLDVTDDVRDDVHWWLEFAQNFNGVSLMLETDFSAPDQVISSDSCLTGGGGFNGTEFFHWSFPEKLRKLSLNINQLECLVLTMAAKLWIANCQRKKLILKCDNLNTVLAINSGSSRDVVLQKCLRELHKILGWHSCEIKTVHIAGEFNRISDSLSRWDNAHFTQQFLSETAHLELTERQITDDMWSFIL